MEKYYKEAADDIDGEDPKLKMGFCPEDEALSACGD